MQSFCEAASGQTLKSITWHADLGSLYGGKGGRIINQVADSPPSYDELDPGPPSPPPVEASGSQGMP